MGLCALSRLLAILAPFAEPESGRATLASMTTDTERDEERVRQLAAKLMTVAQTPDDVRLLPRAVKMLADQQRASKRQKKTQSPRRVRAKG
jgi:hypothetical protein